MVSINNIPHERKKIVLRRFQIDSLTVAKNNRCNTI